VTDLELRSRERAARAEDSPEARARLLVERLRAGTLDVERLGLAAYCGDPAADSALVDGFSESWRFDLIRRRFGLDGWVKGLSRWADVGPVPGWLGAKACHASATVVILRLIDGQPMAHACASLGAQADWLADPTDERLNAWADAWDAAADWNGSPDWLLASSHRLDFDQVRSEILCAAREVGEPTVRFAVQTALVFWALGEP